MIVTTTATGIVVVVPGVAAGAAFSIRTRSAHLLPSMSTLRLTSVSRRNEEFDNLPETDDPIEIRNQVSVLYSPGATLC
jgi:hypothetical protein